MVEITIPIVLQLIQTVALIVGIVYYVTIMRNQQKTRELSLEAQEHSTETRELDIYMKLKLMRTDPVWMRSFFEVIALEWDDFDDFARKYSHTENPEEAAKRFAVWNHWDSLGYILSRGIIDPDTVFDMFGNGCIGQWMKFEPIIQGFREKDGRPETWKWFEYLTNEMMKVRERRGLAEYTMPWRPETP
jgi:hypothetical protein